MILIQPTFPILQIEGENGIQTLIGQKSFHSPKNYGLRASILIVVRRVALNFIEVEFMYTSSRVIQAVDATNDSGLTLVSTNRSFPNLGITFFNYCLF